MFAAKLRSVNFLSKFIKAYFSFVFDFAKSSSQFSTDMKVLLEGWKNANHKRATILEGSPKPKKIVAKKP